MISRNRSWPDTPPTSSGGRALSPATNQDMDDDHPHGFDAVDDQISAMNAPTDAMGLVAGEGGEAVWTIDEILTLAAQLPDEG